MDGTMLNVYTIYEQLWVDSLQAHMHDWIEYLFRSAKPSILPTEIFVFVYNKLNQGY